MWRHVPQERSPRMAILTASYWYHVAPLPPRINTPEWGDNLMVSGKQRNASFTKCSPPSPTACTVCFRPATHVPEPAEPALLC